MAKEYKYEKYTDNQLKQMLKEKKRSYRSKRT